MPAELKYAILAAVLTILSVIIPGARVLTLPFFFALVLILIFWSARRAAEREER